MDNNTAVILDFQSFVDNEGNYIIKELSAMDVLHFASRHWIFKPPVQTVTNDKYVRTNKWLTKHYHGLKWNDGEVPYENLFTLLSDHTRMYKYVFVKGLQKKRFLAKHIIHNNIINLEDFDCPKPDALPFVQGTACLRHLNSRTQCTSHRVHAFRDWMINDFRIIYTFLM